MRKVLLVNDTRLGGHHGSRAVVDVIIREFAKRGIQAVSHLEAGLDLESIGDAGFHGVVINGEGTMHGGQKNAHLFSRIGEEMSRRGLPVFLVNTVFEERTPEIVARMKYFTRIYCRETPSAERLSASGVDARVCPDLTYAVELPPDLAWRPGDAIVVLDTTIASKNRRLHRFALENNLRFQPLRTSPPLVNAADVNNLVRIARFNLTRYAGKLLPRVYAFNRYANAVATMEEFLRRIADGTRVVVAGRFHGVCLCMKLGVPFLAISSNTAKIEGMLADAGLSDRMLDIADLDIDVIRRRASWSTEHDERRKRYVSDAEARIAAMFDDLAQAIG